MRREPGIADWDTSGLRRRGLPVARLLVDGEVRWGYVDGARIALCPPGADAPCASVGDESIPVATAELLAPCRPTKIVCIGLNYLDHCAEMGVVDQLPEPTIFLKPSSSVIGHGETIVYPVQAGRVDHEAELAAVIGRRLSKATPAQAGQAVAGWTCANDVTARDIQKREQQWARGKGFDTFCPLGPWIVPGLDISSLNVKCVVDGKVRQSGNTCEMIHSPFDLIAFVSHTMTLEPGDVVLTGTPAGIGPLSPGELVEVVIEGIGTLSNRIVAEG